MRRTGEQPSNRTARVEAWQPSHREAAELRIANFIETETGDPNLNLNDMDNELGTDTAASADADTEYKLASGSIIGLRKGEKIHDSNPGRPNQAFDAFVLSILRQIGVALEMPLF